MTNEKIINIINWAMLYALASLVVPVLPTHALLYYVILVGATGYVLHCRQERIDLRVVLIVLACVLSIVLNDPPALFKSWGRFGLFFLMLIVASPLCQNEKINTLRLKLFEGVMTVIGIITILSCLAYFLGIDLTIRPKGVTNLFFGGLTGNSMLLAVCTGLSVLYSFNLLLHRQYSRKYKKLHIAWLCVFLLASFLCLLLSGSRGAAISTIAGMLLLLYKQNKENVARFFLYIVILGALGTVTFTLWEPYTKALVEKQRGNDISGSATASRDNKWEARIDEFKSSPIFGIGFSAVDLQNKGDYMETEGIVETGTSWGGMLSMIGLMGFIPFLLLYAHSVWLLLIDEKCPYFSGLLAAVLCWFSVHMIVEGYVLAGGSFLCFILWLTIGAASAYHKLVCKQEKIKEVNNEVTV